MAIETFGGLGDYDIPDGYSEEDKAILRKRILLEEQLDYQKLHEYKPLISVLKDEYLQEHGQEFAGDTRELVDDYAWDMSWFESNEASTFNTAMEKRTDQQNYDLGLKMHIWDRVHNRDWWKIARDHTAAGFSSPTNIAAVAITPFTFGAGGLWLKGGTIAAQQAAKQTIKKSFIKTMTGAMTKNIHKNIVKGVVGEGAVTGAGFGAMEFYQQDVEQQALSPETQAPIREEKDYDDILLMSAVGATTGVVLTSALYAGGKGLKAVFKREMAQNVDQPFGRTPFEELRTVQPAKKTMINKMFGMNIVQKIKRGLTSSAGMPQQLADIHTNNLRKLTAMEEDISRNISDFETIFKRETKKDFNTLSEKEMMPYFNLLHGNTSKEVIGSMPKKVADHINLMRTKIADTSQYALNSGMIKDKKLEQTIKAGIQNKDYVNYSYRLHDDIGWADKLPFEEIVRYENAFKYIKGLKLPDLNTDKKIRAALDKIIHGSKTKHDILGILKEKQKIPDQIRELMGKHVDVRDVYRHTIGKIHSATSEYEFRTAFTEMGGDLGILTKEYKLGLKPLGEEARPFSLTKEGIKDFVEGDLEKSSTNPFDSVYANPTFMKAYNSMRGETARLGDKGGPIVGALSGINGLFTIGHTAYSPMTVSRNVGGGGILNLAAGNWINPIQRALTENTAFAWKDSEMTSFASLVKRLSRGTALNEEDLLLIREAIGHGVLQQGVRAEVLHRNFKDLSDLGATVRQFERDMERSTKWRHKAAREAKRKGFDPIIKFYGMMDDVNKLWAWDTEFRAFKFSYGNSEGKYFIPKRLAMSPRYAGVSVSDPSREGAATTLGLYSKSFGDTVEVSEAMLKGMAAKKTTMYYPTYDQIPQYIKNLRKAPLGNFVAFPTEMIRTTKNNVMLGLEEIYSGNRVMAARGMTRLASTTAVAGGFGGGAVGLTALGFSYITGKAEADLSTEEVDAFKGLQTYDPGAGEYFFHKREVDGDKQVIKASNLGYSDPYAMFKDPLRRAMLAYQEAATLEDTQSQFLSALQVAATDFFEPYLGEKEGLFSVLGLVMARDDKAKFDRAKKRVARALIPVVAQDIAKYSFPEPKTEWGTNVPKLQDYFIGLLSGGLKPKEYDLDMLASRKIAALQRDSTAARKIYMDPISHEGRKKDPTTIEETKDKIREGILQDIDVHKKIWGVVQKLRALGTSEERIYGLLTHSVEMDFVRDKRLSGKKLSAQKAENLMSSTPFYFPANLSKLTAVQNMDMNMFEELNKVIQEYHDNPILLNE